MRGGLWSSFSVPAAGIFTRFEVYSDAGHKPVGLIGVVGVARTPFASEARLELLIRR